MEVNGMGIREYLESQGATTNQVNSKVVDMLADAQVDEFVSSSASAREEFARMQEVLKQADLRAVGLERMIAKSQKEISEAMKLVEQAESFASDSIITDTAVKDGVRAFESMLTSVRDVFGYSAMSEPVICAAIEAASYGMWRSVMGPKSSDGKSGDGKRSKSYVI